MVIRVKDLKITRDEAESLIVREKVIHDKEMFVTVIMAKLKNGHKLVSYSIPGTEDLFDEVKGYSTAKRRLITEIIKYELYRLKFNHI